MKFIALLVASFLNATKNVSLVISSASSWQSLWTVVQWQDHRGAWHDVDGWQGTLDQVVDGEGKKTWWLSKGLLNKGPFRWVVQRTQGGTWLATSERFYLPDAGGRTRRVELSLERP